MIFLTLALLSLLSGTALAGFGGSKSTSPSSLASLPTMGAETSPVAFAWQGQSQVGTESEQYGSSAATYHEQPPPVSEQQALLAYSPSPEVTFYYGGTYLPWTSFTGTFPESYPLFWASTQGGWSWYTTLPTGAWVQELMYVPITGILKVIEIYPDGTTQVYNFGPASQGYRYIWFNGDVPGRHITLFTVGEMASNAVTIDVGYPQDGYLPGPAFQPDVTFASDSSVVYSSEVSQSSSVTVDRDILSGNTVTGNTVSGTIYSGSIQLPDSALPLGQQGQMGKPPGKGINVGKPGKIPTLGR